MAKWGAKRAAADADVRKETHQQKQDKGAGKGIVKGTAERRGEAITRRADLDEAARNERKR